MSTLPAENFLGGVSRQPHPIRFDNQLQESINMNPNVSTGLTKRNNLRLLSAGADPERSLDAFIDSDDFVHQFEDAEGNRYVMAVKGDDVFLPTTPVRIWNVDEASETTVTFDDPNAAHYFRRAATSLDKDTFRSLTVADSTFIVNRETTVEPREFLLLIPYTKTVSAGISVKLGQADSTYSVEVRWDNGAGLRVVLATYTTGAVDSASRRPQNIVDELATQLQANAFFAAEVVLYKRDGVIFLEVSELNATPEIEVRIVSDPVGNRKGIIAINGTVPVFTDLPPAWDVKASSKIKITGSNDNNFTDYYVRWQTAGSTTALPEGDWVETSIGDGAIDTGFLSSTAPIILKRDNIYVANKGYGFTIGHTFPNGADYTARVVGDTKTATDPSFVNQKINDVVFYQNRLGFLTGENIVLSEINNFNNFYPTTVLDILASDPIDVAADSGELNSLERAVPYDGGLVVFSKQAQFILRGDGSGLSPSSASLNPVSRYESNTKSKPIPVARAILFANSEGTSSSKVMEFTTTVADVYGAADTTIHIPQYIEGNMRGITAHATDRTIVCWSDTEQAILYVNNFLWEGDAKVQNAWHKWDLANVAQGWDKILSAHFHDDNLVVIVNSASGFTHALEIRLTDSDVDAGVDFRYNLDYRLEKADMNPVILGNGNLQLEYPYGDPLDLPQVYVMTGTTLLELPILNVAPATVGILIEVEDTAATVSVGMVSEFSFRLSKPTLKNPQNGKPVLHALNQLELKAISIFHEDTGRFKVTQSSKARDPAVSEMDGTVTNVTAYNNAGLSTDVFEALIGVTYRDFDVSITSNNIFPATFVNKEYHISAGSFKG